jgi:PAS domain S-box-containing protein
MGEQTFEEPVEAWGGETCWMHTVKRAVRLADGQEVIVSVRLDISDRRRAEQELGRSREFLHLVLDTVPAPVFVKDSEHRWVLVNEAFAKFQGLLPEELLGRTDFDYFPAEQASRLWEQDDEVLEKQSQLSAEEHFTNAVGEERWVNKSKRGVRLASGERLVIGSIVDVTESKRASLEVERSRAFLAAIVDAIPNPVFVKDSCHRWVIVNDAFCRLMGRAREELTGKSDFDVLDVAAASAAFEEDDGALAGEEPVVVERMTVMRDGRNLWLLKTKRAVRLPDGTAYVVGSLLDVGRRRQAEQTLDVAIWAAGMGLWTWAPATGETYYSPVWKQQLGYDEDEVPNHPDEWLARLHPDDRERVLARLRGVVRSRDVFYNVEFRLRHKDGSYRWFLSRARIERDGQGHALRLIGVHIDITDLKRAQEALERYSEDLERTVASRTAELSAAKDAAEAASRAKSEFLANISHELRTPMHAILSFAQLGIQKIAAGNPPAHKLQHYFGRIDQSGGRLLALLNDLLDLSKLEAGGMRCEMVEGDLAAVVGSVLAELRPLATERGVIVKLEQPRCDTAATFDPSRIGQVVRNLVANAIKFTPAGRHVRLRIEAEEAGFGVAGGGAVEAALRLTVSDEGVGIPPDELEDVFEKFVQSSKTKSGAGGTGLGLAITREIVTRHGGRVWATNNAAGGADFAVLLPRHARLAAATDRKEETEEMA